jgi:hypothetical protein
MVLFVRAAIVAVGSHATVRWFYVEGCQKATKGMRNNCVRLEAEQRNPISCQSPKSTTEEVETQTRIGNT